MNLCSSSSGAWSRIAPRAGLLALITALLVAPRLVAQESGGEASPLGADILDVLDKGGVVMWIIILLSIVGLAFAFERLVALRLGVLVPSGFVAAVKNALGAKKLDEVERLSAETQGPLARILAAGLKRRTFGAREVERALEVAGAHEVHRLRRPVRPLSILANVEPLLGLLGTILGMISTFNILHTTSAAERVQKLAPGIGQALYTTAAGLCVAIPFVILYHFLLGKVNRAAEEWSLLGTDLVGVVGTVAQGGEEMPV